MADDEKPPVDDDDALAETQPINNATGKQDDVDTRVEQPKKGWFVTRTKVVLIVIGVLLLIILLGVLAGVLRPRCPCTDSNGPRTGAVYSGYRMSTPRPTVSPSLPWAGIRLPRNIIPSHYNIELKIDLEHFNFSGSVDIDVTVLEPTDYIIVHVNSLQIQQSEVSVQNMRKKERIQIYKHIPVPINQFYVIQTRHRLSLGEKYRIRFGHFQGKLSDDLRGLYRSMYKDQFGRIRYLAASQLQSVDARKVFPCFDEPDLKANFSVAIIHRNEFTALSNMPLVKSNILRSGWVRDQFSPTPLMSTYLLAFVVADFRHRGKVVDDGLQIRIWAQPDMYDQTEYALEFAEEAYRFFAGYFGTPEVVPKADHAAIPDFSAGAMENWGLTLYRETALLHDDEVSSISNKYWVSLVMAHEIAHTWFGNMVTMKWWDDLWLNEGFANTLMYFALDNIYPTWKVFDLQLVNNVYPVMTKDSLLTSHSISTPIIDPDDIPQYFDSISYDKGMAVLRLLRGFLGWSDFKKGLQMYIRKYKYKNAEMSELWATFAEAVNNKYDVGDIMDTWTRQMGFPVVTVRHISGRRYRLEQSRFLLNPEDKYDPHSSPFGYKWRIPFSYKIQNRNEVRTQWMGLTKSKANVEVPQGSWIIGNVDYMGFYRTNYDETMWRRLTDQLKLDHRIFSPANRAGLISDAFNLARANLLNYEIALNLTSYLWQEEDYVPWRAFFDSIDFIKGMLSTSSAYGQLNKYIYDLVAPIYRQVGTSDQGDLLERNLRRAMLQVAAQVGVPDAIEWAQRMFGSWMQYGTKIPPDYAVVIFSVGIEQGGEREWDHLWNTSQSSRVASESEIMMNALAYTQKPWLLWRFARWSLDSSKIRMQDVRNLFRYFAATPLGRSVSLQFLLTNWDEINRRFGMDAFLLRDIIYATTSLINTEYEFRQLEQLYRHSPPAGVASKAADNSLALVRSNIKWLRLNQGIITRWLNKHVDSEYSTV